MKKFPDFEHALPDEPEYDSWLWDGTGRREQEPKKIVKPETKEQPKPPAHTAEKQEKKHPEKKPKETQVERSKAKTPEQREEDRETIVEKSLQLKKHFENEPLPKDPHLVARLLVAEHILALNEQLEERKPNKNAPTPEELSIALDYMGSLANKLEDPTIEATPDIEEAYEALIELTEEALLATPPQEIIDYASIILEPEIQASPPVQPEPHTESIPAAIPPTSSQTPVTASSKPVVSLPVPPSQASAILVTTLAALPVAVINHQRQLLNTPPTPAAPSSPPEAGGYFAPYSSTPEYASLPPRPPSPAEARTNPSPAASERKHSPRTPNLAPIAAIALTAVATSPERPLGKSTSPNSLRHETAPRTPVASEAVPQTTTKPSRETFYPSAYEENRPQTLISEAQEAAHYTSSSHEVVAAYTKKLEHLPLHTLLAMAENVPLGYGRYLRQEFESNQIDKAGLIKVLKARAKGRDFSMEYREQAARFRTIKLSPEFLRATTPSNEPSIPITNHESAPLPSQVTKPVPSESSKTTPKIMEHIKAAAARLGSQEDIPPLPAESQTPWIIAIIIALVILAVILFFLF